MIDVVKSSTELEIDGKTYNLTVKPSYTDEIVQREVKNVLGQLDLENVTKNLYLSVELFHVAYNGVAAAQDGSVRADINTLQSKLALLCNECVITMSTFKAESENIADQIISCYKWLTKGKEQLAIRKLEHCKNSSTLMSNKAMKLADEFKELQIGSTSARSKALTEETNQENIKLEAETAKRELVAKQEAQKVNAKELIVQIDNIQTLYNEAKEQEEIAAKRALFIGLTSAVTSALGAGLGAYTALSNPVGTALLSMNTAGGDNETKKEIKKSQKEERRKKKEFNEVKSKLLIEEDQLIARKKLVDKLQKEFDQLKESIITKEEDSSTDEEELNTLKKSKDDKQIEIKAAQKELEDSKNKIKPLKEESKRSAAAYAGAATALQDLAKSTSQMASSAATAEESIHKEKMKYLNRKLELEKEKRESLVALTEYAECIKNQNVKQGQATLSVNSLHAAVDALGKIIGTLTNASLFWNQMADYCSRMSSSGFQQNINDLTDPSNGLTIVERLEEYKDFSFMKQFLLYICQWVAVNGISGDYVIAATTAQKKAVEYLSKSPTIEEATRLAPILAENLKNIVEKNLQESRAVSLDLEQQKSIIEVKNNDND